MCIRDRGGALHPVEVGAGREAFSSSGEDDDADVIVFVEGDAGGGEFGDEDFVEGVVAVSYTHLRLPTRDLV